jgi:tripartite-type tricarboxylate transporter receptor subunit TctC
MKNQKVVQMKRDRIGHFLVVSTLMLSVSLQARAAEGENYPNRPITLIAPFAPNGPADAISRSLGAVMSKNLKQSIVIENVGGAGGTVGAVHVARAEPDGYTLLLYHVGMATVTSLYKIPPFDPIRDFEFLGEVAEVPATLVARPDFPARTLKDVTAYIRSRRGEVTLAQAGVGSASQLCGLVLAPILGANVKTLDYKGSGPALDDLLSNKVDLLCDLTLNTAPQIRAGRVLPLGISTSKRIASLPNVPTLQEGGLTNFDWTIWFAMYAPKNTPAPILKRLNEALQVAVSDAGVKARLIGLGAEATPLSKATPQYAREHFNAEIKRWGPIIKRAGIRAD